MFRFNVTLPGNDAARHPIVTYLATSTDAIPALYGDCLGTVFRCKDWVKLQNDDESIR